MTSRMNSSTTEDAVRLLMQKGMNGFTAAIELFMNAAIVRERQAYLGAGHYERHSERVSYANCFKAKP